jgi:hypothetical protein
MQEAKPVESNRSLSIREFYWLPIQSEDSKSSTAWLSPKLINPAKAPTVEVGDVMILVGMHLITKEVDSWTWNTYWWADEKHRQSPGYGHDRPQGLAAPWNNYVMAATIEGGGKQRQDGKAENAVFNPYQESQLSNPGHANPQWGGLGSNCLSCHARAAFPFDEVKYPKNLVTLGETDPNQFANRIQTGFLWSVADFAQRETAKPPQVK